MMNKRKKVVILTGNELRHRYFRKKMGLDKRFIVSSSFCEDDSRSLKNTTYNNENSTWIENKHVESREQSEIDFFKDFDFFSTDLSNPVLIKKGDINSSEVVSAIEAIDPELILCYGSSLIKSSLLKKYHHRFINVHLGISPFYRGSGTNIYPFINQELDMVGATFMYIDEGIDTGEIIHQIQASFFLGDSPHSVGNRLIRDMTDTYANVVANFEHLKKMEQPVPSGKLYLRKDFTTEVCERLYEIINNNIIGDYLKNNTPNTAPPLVQNTGLNK